jgi:hypothetical protein
LTDLKPFTSTDITATVRRPAVSSRSEATCSRDPPARLSHQPRG